MPPMTGRVIAGRYILDQPIGRGAMGVVWRGHDQLLDREVAVKEVVLSSSIGSDERKNAYQRTLREARTAARLSHRGVVTVYDVAEEDGRPWIVMELVPSRSLDQVLSVEGRMKPLRAGRIGQQLLAALASAHASGVLHRDVKPSNVLIARERAGAEWNERAVLTDFGIAQFEGDPRLTQTGMVMGSPGFTAPERIRGGAATPASDLWSLGATIYSAVEGCGPYEQRGGAITTMSAIINEDAPVAASSGPLAPLIAALLRREPSARPSAAAAARMFSDVLPLLSSVAAEPAHPATIRSAHVSSPSAAPGAPAAEVAPPAASVPPASVVSAAEAAEAAEAAPPAPAAVASAVPEAEAAGAADFADGAGDESMVSSAAAGPMGASGVAVGEKDAAASDGASDGDEASDSVGASDGVGDAAGAGEGDAVVAAALAGVGAAAIEVAGAMPPDPPAPAATSLDMVPDDLVAPPDGSADLADDAHDAPLRVELPAPSFSPSRPAPPVSPQPAPSFSASRPVAADPPTTPQPPYPAPQHGDQTPPWSSDGQWPSDAQWGSKTQWGSSAQRGGSSTPYGSNAQYQKPNPQYAGPSQPYQDLAQEYPPGTTGRPRRSRRGRTIALIAAAVVIAAAAGGGAAFALRGHGGGTTVPPSPTTAFGSVNALNNPSATVPSGWTPETVRASADGTTAGFSIDMPPGWTEQRSGMATHFTSPNGMFLDVDLTPHTYQNMVNEAKFIRDQSLLKGTFPGYKQDHLQAVPVRGTQGAFWQFAWSPADNVRQLTDDILFILKTSAGSQSYALYFRAPDNGWSTTYLPVFEQILRTFEPATS
jgi:eukaryotic-like serine/threonine-protein kinase